MTYDLLRSQTIIYVEGVLAKWQFTTKFQLHCISLVQENAWPQESKSFSSMSMGTPTLELGLLTLCMTQSFTMYAH